MANWAYNLDLKEAYSKYTDEEVEEHVPEVSKIVADKIDALNLPGRFGATAKRIASEFRVTTTIDGFNRLMDKLYDLGDQSITGPGYKYDTKLMWVATF